MKLPSLIKILTTNEDVKCIGIRDEEISHHEASVLFGALKINTAVEELTLKNCKIDDVSACAIFAALILNTTLKRLDLSNNEIEYTLVFCVWQK